MIEMSKQKCTRRYSQITWGPGWKCAGSKVALRSQEVVTPILSSMVGDIHSIMWGRCGAYRFFFFYIRKKRAEWFEDTIQREEV